MATNKIEDEVEAAAGAPGPASWRLYGLLALGAVILVLLVLRFADGNRGPDVIPGTPTAAPQTEQTGK